jgi:predicted O-methyltransferase YrrM
MAWRYVASHFRRAAADEPQLRLEYDGLILQCQCEGTLVRRIGHLTPRYILDRVSVIVDELRYPSHPWLTADAVKILATVIRPGDTGVEFGSGRSTVWLAQRLATLVSVEMDKRWYHRIRGELQSAGVAHKVDYRLIVTDREYAEQANSFAANSVDFCLVDGAVRDQCTLLMLPKLRRGGVLAIDNVNWFLPDDGSRSPNSRRSRDGYATEIWQEVERELRNWRMIWTSNGVTDTAIWFKV